MPRDAELEDVLQRVRLGLLLERGSRAEGAGGLDNLADWGGILSLGEQQRLAFARWVGVLSAQHWPELQIAT